MTFTKAERQPGWRATLLPLQNKFDDRADGRPRTIFKKINLYFMCMNVLPVACVCTICTPIESHGTEVRGGCEPPWGY